jgi:hypothetical protein
MIIVGVFSLLMVKYCVWFFLLVFWFLLLYFPIIFIFLVCCYVLWFNPFDFGRWLAKTNGFSWYCIETNTARRWLITHTHSLWVFYAWTFTRSWWTSFIVVEKNVNREIVHLHLIDFVTIEGKILPQIFVASANSCHLSICIMTEIQ